MATGDATVQRRVDVQGMRGLAVLAVIAYHAGLPVTGGFVGVDIFFVISGFVITRMLWVELQTSGTIRLGRFYGRRARRLLPALAVVLVVVALASAVLESPLGSQQNTAATGAGAALFAGNAVLFRITGGYFDLASESNPLLHTWTLAVEEQFYLVFPFFLLAGWVTGDRMIRGVQQRRSVVLGLIWIIAGVSFLLGVAMTFSQGFPFGDLPTNSRFAFFGSPTRAWEFAAGCLLALTERDRPRGRLVAAALRVAGLALISYAVLAFDAATRFPGVAALVPVVGASLLIAAGARSEGALARRSILVWIGNRSYSWYLWHWPCIVFALTIAPASKTWPILAAIASLAPAALSYSYLEQPLRRARLAPMRAVGLSVACAALPLMLFGGLQASTALPLTAVRQARAQAVPHLDESRGCDRNQPADPVTRTSCTWDVPDAVGTVMLLGDSNAGHFAEPVLAASRAEHMRLVLATFGGCPFADVHTSYDVPFDEAACATFIHEWTAEVARVRPSVVILGNASSEYLHAGNGVTFVSDSRSASTQEAKQAAWEAGLDRTLGAWAAAGVPTVIVRTVPHFADFDLRGCSTLALVSTGGCAQDEPTDELVAKAAAADAAEAAVLRDRPLAVPLDLTRVVCPNLECSTRRQGMSLYRDGAHLSVPFARTLTDRFRSAIEDAVSVHGLS